MCSASLEAAWVRLREHDSEFATPPLVPLAATPA